MLNSSRLKHFSFSLMVMKVLNTKTYSNILSEGDEVPCRPPLMALKQNFTACW